MSGAKETPRQKMIGMMYLVYTALLAMNVSKDILDAFDTVNMGVQETNITLMQQIKRNYANFEQQSNEAKNKDKKEFRENWQKAQNLREKSDKIINYIEAMKWEMVSNIEKKDFDKAVEQGLLKSSDTIQYSYMSNGQQNYRLLYNINTSKIKSRDNYNKPTAYMMGDPEGNGKAFELSEKIREYRREIVNIVGEQHANELGLITDSINGERIDYAPEAADGIQKGWEYHNFHHTVLIADITLLNKIISEIETAELDALTKLAQDVYANDATFEKVGAKIFADSKYILSGQKYHAQAMVTAWQNTPITAKISLDGGPEKEYASNSQGAIDLDFSPGVGTHRIRGTVEMHDPKTDSVTVFDLEEETFTVAPPAVSVSAVKMNVVYAGIDNPIAIGGGVGGEISASASGASLSRTGNGTYNLRVNPGHTGDVVVTVSSQGSSLGSMKFRVKELPKPTAKIDNVIDGKVSKNALLAANMVRAEMKDFDFDGVKYDVVGYTVKYRTKAGTMKEEKISGSRFNETLKGVFNSANTGDIFVFTGIQVKGNDNKVKVLDSQIAVEIK
ncbi:MAG: hypothetical protein II887_04210 [Bacteroidales bacterium]|nr:hypothetical protein [Bacteroidales bacterium]